MDILYCLAVTCFYFIGEVSPFTICIDELFSQGVSICEVSWIFIKYHRYVKGDHPTICSQSYKIFDRWTDPFCNVGLLVLLLVVTCSSCCRLRQGTSHQSGETSGQRPPQGEMTMQRSRRPGKRFWLLIPCSNNLVVFTLFVQVCLTMDSTPVAEFPELVEY